MLLRLLVAHKLKEAQITLITVMKTKHKMSRAPVSSPDRFLRATVRPLQRLRRVFNSPPIELMQLFVLTGTA